MSDYGVLPTGFARKPLSVLLAEFEQKIIAIYGAGIIQTSQSPQGQLNGFGADIASDLYDVAEDTYQSYDPDQAEGVRLDVLARIRLLERMSGEQDESFRQAITNVGRMRFDIEDFKRAVASIDGVTYSAIFINDSSGVDANGLEPHSIAVAAIGGDDEEIAQIANIYIVPGIGSSGNQRVDVNIDGVCRTIYIVRPTAVPIKLYITVRRYPDNLGCPPPSVDVIEEGLHADLNNSRRLLNGQDVTEFILRSIIEGRYPNVEVLSAIGERDGEIDSGSILPIDIAFTEIATFTLEDIEIVEIL